MGHAVLPCLTVLIFSRSEKMSSKVFSERFNRELALIGLPDELTDKIKAVAKVFNISRHAANALIFGHQVPTSEQLDNIAEVLDVCPRWLGGITDRKKSYSKSESIET
jgi:hypothetical protein